MIDTFKAIFGKCPWCGSATYSAYDRVYDKLPVWLVTLEIMVNQFWRIGRWWHRRFHEVGSN